MFVYGLLSLPLLTPSENDGGLWLYCVLKAVMISVENTVVLFFPELAVSLSNLWRLVRKGGIQYQCRCVSSEVCGLSAYGKCPLKLSAFILLLTGPVSGCCVTDRNTSSLSNGREGTVATLSFQRLYIYFCLQAGHRRPAWQVFIAVYISHQCCIWMTVSMTA